MGVGSWIIGTIILWVLKAVGTMPLARRLSQSRGSPGPASRPTEEALGPAEEAGPAQGEAEIPAGMYILADVIVMGAAGFLLGLLTGYYFIGFSWKARDWPGMIVFIIASLVGSAL